MRRGPAVIVAAGLITRAAAPLAAQAPDLAFPSAVPESPAFVFLGAAPSDVLRPGTARDLGAALLSGISRDGKVQQGLAVELVPSFLVPGLSIPLADYRDSRLKYALANTQLSLATVRSAGDTASTDLSLGVRITLWDASDPMLDRAFAGDVASGFRSCLARVTPDTPEAEVQVCTDSAFAAAKEGFEERDGARWNAARVMIGGATGLRFASSLLGERDGLGFQGWLTGGFPLGRRAQIVAQLSWLDRPQAGEEEAHTLLSYGGRLVFGSTGFNAFAELVGERKRGDVDVLDDDRGSWSAGVEWRVAESLWLATGIGARFEALEAERTVVLANVRWGIGDSARLESLREGGD
ncbi:MAG TPA: hypothetical protein VK849_08815 [Longimicrobiales bacterium]|nr:hypothetical protein [Longimicrobiales bacterium]